MAKDNIPKVYEPQSFEKKWYEFWEKNDFFHAEPEEGKKPFSIVIPPPNVTGQLHMGHALDETLQDILIRWRRMQGYNTLWMPGCDHAGIATQAKVEAALREEGTNRYELGREKFTERVWQWKEEYGSRIMYQLRTLGSSCDWARERFTMDEGCSRAVREVFVSLYEKGLIYQGTRITNWCPSCNTALSDIEVEHETEAGHLWHLRYAFEDGEGYVEIATTRPETMFGDTGIAVHPDDARYKDLVGRNVILPIVNRPIPIFADEYVDPSFGTGAVKVTPAHDPNDWLVGKRNDLDVINILNPDGTLNDNCPERYRGLSCAKARALIIEDLKAQNLFKGEEKITHAVGHCYRCNTVVEPYLSDQWFVKMQPLAQKALRAWKNGDIEFFPRKWENTYKVWLENIRDWCISRQLWWGHRIPVWYCKKCGETIVSREDVHVCPKCSSTELEQDPDVLDTWFSSWLWPFSTLGWPEETDDSAKFYPTSALVTAYDIIFFWVSRMIMAGIEFTGKAPFHDIYIHGLVRDRQGRKMSKSLGNGIDPLEIVDMYGSDAFKFTLGFMCAQGQDVLIDRESFKLGSRFANKVWNASRYILGNLEGRNLVPVRDEDLTELDRWIYTELDRCVRAEREALESYRYNDAASSLYEYFWNEYCDWYVEATKLSFKNGSDAEKDRAVSVLLNVLEENIRLLHPFLPFVTEEIYAKLPLAEIVKNRKLAGANKILSTSDYSGMLIASPFPEASDARVDESVTRRFNVLRELIKGVRALRAECGIDPASKIRLALMIEKGSAAEVCAEKSDIIMLLAGISHIDFVDEKPASSIGTVVPGAEAFLLIDESIDKTQLASRFQKEKAEAEAIVARSEAKLSGKFAEHAAKELVEAEKAKLEENRRRIEKLASYMQSL